MKQRRILPLYATFQIFILIIVKADISTINLSASDGSRITNLSGKSDHDRMRPSVKVIGDINGDGMTDFAIGMPYYDYYTGKVAIVYGTKSGIPSMDIEKLTPSQGFTFGGDGSGDEFGVSVTPLGDVNGDGINDFAVGSPAAYRSGARYGAVYVIFGKPTSSFVSNKYASSFLSVNGGYMITTSEKSIGLGYAVSGAGDLNGDGIADIVIGAPYYNQYTKSIGRAYVVYGKTDPKRSTLYVDNMTGTDGFYILGRSSYSGYFGNAVTSVGDWNEDGIDDVAIGSNSEGVVYVVYGRSDFPTFISVESLNATTGFNITSRYLYLDQTLGTGDVNHDGKTDLIIGSAVKTEVHNKFNSDVFVVFGSKQFNQTTINIEYPITGQVLRISNTIPKVGLGYSVSMAGDVNGDGIDDIIISAPGLHYTYGAVYVIFGAPTINTINLLQPDIMRLVYGYAITSSINNTVLGSTNTFGASVSGSIDLNNDGINDILITEIYEGNPMGSLYIIYGTAKTAIHYNLNGTGSSPNTSDVTVSRTNIVTSTKSHTRSNSGVDSSNKSGGDLDSKSSGSNNGGMRMAIWFIIGAFLIFVVTYLTIRCIRLRKQKVLAVHTELGRFNPSRIATTDKIRLVSLSSPTSDL